MERLWPDAELDALVRRLNEPHADGPATLPEAGPAASAPVPGDDVAQLEPVDLEPGAPLPAGSSAPAPEPAPAPVTPPPPLDRWLREMVTRGASDLVLLGGEPPAFRVDGRLMPAGEPLPAAQLGSLLGAAVPPAARARLDRDGAVDLSLRVTAAGGVARRFRVNVHRQRGELAAAVRLLAPRVPSLDQLGLPAVLRELARAPRGLVLVCGPTGSGKSTTLAALVDEINSQRPAHVITIEDPIEYEHRGRRAVIEQVEVGSDSPSFAGALRAALRQDPDVLLVGEMRDLETVATALSAAETGHLVLSSLHTNDVVQAVHRIVDVFPAPQQTQIRQQLALVLLAFVGQQLVPRRDGGGRVLAVEVLLANPAVRNLIRKDQVEKVYSELTLGKRLGMVSMDESLARLVREGVVDVEEARLRASRPDELESHLRG